MLIAQISDTHIREPGQLCDGKVDTAAHLKRAVARLNLQKPAPDLVIVTGDLVDEANPEEYAHLRLILDELSSPYFVIMGNHDRRENLRESFGDHEYLPKAGFIQYTIERFPVRIIALDTNLQGKHSGSLCEDRLAWIEARLAEQPSRPTVLAMHPPLIKPATWHGIDFAWRGHRSSRPLSRSTRILKRSFADIFTDQRRRGLAIRSPCPALQRPISFTSGWVRRPWVSISSLLRLSCTFGTAERWSVTPS